MQKALGFTTIELLIGLITLANKLGERDKTRI